MSGETPKRSVLLLSGPNLNLLGVREPETYGTDRLADHVDRVAAVAGAARVALDHIQSNAEADLVDAIHRARDLHGGIIINPGAFTHYSWAIHDALAAFDGHVIELHLSNTRRRESWRHTSVVTPVATGVIAGFGAKGYDLAMGAMIDLLGAG